MCRELAEVWQLEENPLARSCFFLSLLTLQRNFLENLCGVNNTYGLSTYGDTGKTCQKMYHLIDTETIIFSKIGLLCIHKYKL